MLKLAACASLHMPVGNAPVDLRALLKQETGHSFRRINRYIELSLLGSLHLRRALGQAVPADTALYFCLDSGMLADTIRIMGGYVRDKRAPTPFEFMNVSGSMASFHVAQMLALQGPQLSLHRNHVSLEAAMQLLQLKSAPHRRALIGFVEEGCWPRKELEDRLQWRGAFAECSHWLYFDADAAAPLAEIESCTRYDSLDALAATLSAQDRSELHLSASDANHAAADAGLWADNLGLKKIFVAPDVWESGPVFSGGLPALSLVAFVRSEMRGRLLHLNRNGSGEFFATLMRKS